MRIASDDQPELTIFEAASALAMPVAAVSILESFILLVVARGTGAPELSHFMLNHGHWFLALVIAITCYPACRRGRQGILASCAGIAIAFFCMNRFKGSYEWYGTFTVYDRNPHYWEFAGSVGFGAALIAGLAAKDPQSGFKNWPVVGAVMVSAAAFLSWFDTRTYVSFSLFAPTRHLALLIILIGVLLSVGVQKIQGRISDEKKSVFTN